MNVLDIAKQIGQAIEEGDAATLQRLATELAGYASHPRHREFAQALLNRIDTAVTALQAGDRQGFTAPPTNSAPTP